MPSESPRSRSGRSTDDRTNAIVSLVRCPLQLSKSVGELMRDYRAGKPFPHLVLDNLFPAAELKSVISEFPQASSDKWVHEKNERFIKSNLRSAVYLEEHSYRFTSMLHSAAFLYLITKITGIPGLLPDPYLSGAGYRVMGADAKFELHADTNHDNHCGLRRRLAMMIYLNEDWKSEFGGQLELWNQDASECKKVIEPMFNRTVIMEVGDVNFHAVRKVTSQAGGGRKSFMTYFHTVDKHLVPHHSIYGYRDDVSLLSRVARATLPSAVREGLGKWKHRTARSEPLSSTLGPSDV